jgi:hypothetical protein
MDPYISVIVPTFRPGGLDVLFNCLKNQSFKNFELILVDMIYEHRKPFIFDLINSVDWGFNIKHVEPIDNVFPFAAFAHMMNTGFVHAEGEIIFNSSDYIWFPSDCLQKHADFHKANPNRGYMGPHIYFDTPKLKVIPPWDKPEMQSGDTPTRGQVMYTYVDDLNAGKYNHVMWSLFEEPIVSDPVKKYPLSNQYKNIDVKLTMPSGWYDEKSFHFKNESYPLEFALNVNGCDEDQNGAHTTQDIEFPERLTLVNNTNWYFESDNGVYGFWVKDSELPRLRRLRPLWCNRLMLELKRNVGFKNESSAQDPYLADLYANRMCNDWNLRDHRNKLLNK